MPLRYDEVAEIKAMIKEAIDAALEPKKAEVVSEPLAAEVETEAPVKKGKK